MFDICHILQCLYNSDDLRSDTSPSYITFYYALCGPRDFQGNLHFRFDVPCSSGVNRQKWTITAQNININVIGSSSNGTNWLNFRCVNCSNCRTNYWKVLNRNINHVSWQFIDWYRLMHLPVNTSSEWSSICFIWVSILLLFLQICY
jgi:hypothetical protein